MRPRSVLGLVRSRAPLSIMLYVAAREGRLVWQDSAGLAMLEPPLLPPWLRPRGFRASLLRLVDRRWDLLWFVGPPALLLLGAVALLPIRAALPFAALLAVVVICYVTLFMAAGLIVPLAIWARRRGQPRLGQYGAESLPAYHWSIPLLHQERVERVDHLIRQVSDRVARLIQAELGHVAALRGARIEQVQVVESLILLSRGITTQDARRTAASVVNAEHPFTEAGDIIVLISPGRLDRHRQRPVVGGGFVFLYLFGLAVTIVVIAVFAASWESAACLPDACAGRPATFATALRWLVQRLWFTDPPTISPATSEGWIIGNLVSLAGLTALPVAVVSVLQQLKLTKQRQAEVDELLANATGRSRVLILVVNPVERDAAIASIAAATGGRPSPVFHDERTTYMLGRIGGTEILLAQAGEQGTTSAGAMTLTARDAIAQCHPDYLILLGVCFGLWPDRQEIGDVLISQRVHNLDHRRVRDGETDREIITIARGENVQASHVLLDRCNAAEATWPQQWATIHIGLILSSNMLVESQTVLRQLRETYPDALGGEMESAGVYAAASAKKIDWIMVKGIADWGTPDRDRSSQPTAAPNAADFVTHMISMGALDRPREQPL